MLAGIGARMLVSTTSAESSVKYQWIEIQGMHTGVALTWPAESALEGAVAIILYFPVTSDLEVSWNMLIHGRVHVADMADPATPLWSCQCSGKLCRTV